MKFRECKQCAQKPGSPALCAKCLKRRIMLDKKPLFPQKGTIVLMLNDGIVIAGKGSINATKMVGGEFCFEGTLVKDYS